MELDAALPLIAQMVAALKHAHAAGIVHRDFKSDNVMLVPRPDGAPERLVVMDFGLARQSLVGAAQPLTPHSRAVFGTLDYMSPEQVMGKPASPASDIYSLGTVIYELLSGRLPFEGDSPLARAVLRVTQKAPALVDVLPGVDAAVNACIAKCLETKGDHRFATVDEVLHALRGEPQVARSVRFGGRNAIASVALSFALGVGVSMFMRPHRAEQTARGRAAAAKWSPEVPRATVRSSQSAGGAPAAKDPAEVAPAIKVPIPPGVSEAASPAVAARRAARKRSEHRALEAQGPMQLESSAAASADVLSPPQPALPVPGGDALMNPFAGPPQAAKVQGHAGSGSSATGEASPLRR